MPAAGRRRPIRSATVELDGDYAGTWAKVRINPPLRVFDLFGTSTRDALAAVIIEWNLVDDDGKPVELDPTLSGATDEEAAALARGYLTVLSGATELPKEPPTPSGTTTPSST